ncbi:SEC-C metal-binding domain-containing protein [Alteribacillus sp. HJP-4]|uniref:SEC-C metal-binding domain-containing protein n=1 Tax=Alteribacillus sp. HJP-4 TaxID=2775394 RepID=UPI0035CCEB0B
MTTGRNDPCPCGSGKKYKKCCGKISSLPVYSEGEILEVQEYLRQFAVEGELELLNSFYQKYYHYPSLPEEYTFSLENLSAADLLFGTSPEAEHLSESISQIKNHPRMTRLFQGWRESPASVYMVTQTKEGRAEVIDLWTAENYHIELSPFYKTLPEELLILGHLLPVKDKNYLFFGGFIIEKDCADGIQLAVKRLADKHSVKPEDLFNENLPLVFQELVPIINSYERSAGEAPGLSPAEEEVFELFLEKANPSSKKMEETRAVWERFCYDNAPLIKNPASYAAALEYIFSRLTQKQIAEKYNISNHTVSKMYRRIVDNKASLPHDFLRKPASETDIMLSQYRQTISQEKMMYDMTKAAEQHVDSGEDIDSFNPTEKNSIQMKTKKEQAQLSLYEALLADDQAKIDKIHKKEPDLPDYYILKAIRAESEKEVAHFYSQAVAAGRKFLGSAFFKKNKGDFWGIVDTRPFMRAMYDYGIFLRGTENPGDAAEIFKEMLELNPNDNQGVRYELLPLLLEEKQLKEAKLLLKRYDEQSAFMLFDKAILEFLEHGATSTFRKRWKDATDFNPYVLKLLHRLDDNVMEPIETYSPGGESEAKIYIQTHLGVFVKNDNLLNKIASYM